MSARGLGVLVLALATVAIAGCGEKPSVTVYKQGHYQGKPDNVPWQGKPFNDNRLEWEKAIKSRNNAQNEYLRVGTN